MNDTQTDYSPVARWQNLSLETSACIFMLTFDLVSRLGFHRRCMTLDYRKSGKKKVTDCCWGFFFFFHGTHIHARTKVTFWGRGFKSGAFLRGVLPVLAWVRMCTFFFFYWVPCQITPKSQILIWMNLMIVTVQHKISHFRSIMFAKMNKSFRCVFFFFCSAAIGNLRETFHAKLSQWKIFLSRSCGSQGQFQGQMMGQKVKWLKYAPIFSMISESGSLWNSLSNNICLVKIDPVVPEVWQREGGHAPFLPN